jgi:hypothetical protein
LDDGQAIGSKDGDGKDRTAGAGEAITIKKAQ